MTNEKIAEKWARHFDERMGDTDSSYPQLVFNSDGSNQVELPNEIEALRFCVHAAITDATKQLQARVEELEGQLKRHDFAVRILTSIKEGQVESSKDYDVISRALEVSLTGVENSEMDYDERVGTEAFYQRAINEYKQLQARVEEREELLNRFLNYCHGVGGEIPETGELGPVTDSQWADVCNTTQELLNPAPPSKSGGEG